MSLQVLTNQSAHAARASANRALSSRARVSWCATLKVVASTVSTVCPFDHKAPLRRRLCECPEESELCVQGCVDAVGYLLGLACLGRLVVIGGGM